MPKYKLKASAWHANSETQFGTFKFDDENEAENAAFDMACENISVWVELIEDEE